MSYFENSSQFLQVVKYENLAFSHQNALKLGQDRYQLEKHNFLSHPYHIGMQLSWFNSNSNIPLDIVDWYETEVSKGNIPYGIHLCCQYVSTKMSSNEEHGGSLVPMFLFIRPSKKELPPGLTMALKATLSFQESGNSYKLTIFKDSATLSRGTETIEQWFRCHDMDQNNLNGTWFCETSIRTQKNWIPAGQISMNQPAAFNQVFSLFKNYIASIPRENYATYEQFSRALARAVVSVCKDKSTMTIYPIMMALDGASSDLINRAKQSKTSDLSEVNIMFDSLIRALRQIEPGNERVKDLASMKIS